MGGRIFESKVYTTCKGRVFAVPTLTRAKRSEKKDNMVTQKLVQDNEQDLQLLLGTKQLPGQQVQQGIRNNTTTPTENKQNFF